MSLPLVPSALAMVAGEASGDLLAADVLAGLRTRAPGLRCVGVGGPRMREQGFEAWHDIEELSVRGYVEVLRHLPRLLALRAGLRRRWLAQPPACFVGVDAPDFNLSLERALRAAGIRTVHFISPSIWAWRRERLEAIRAAVDHMLLVFPFEQRIYDEAGIPATYVGHPLADRIPEQVDVAAARARIGLSGPGRVVALLPGSRPAEIDHLADPFVDTARWLWERMPDLRFALPAASAQLHATLAARLQSLRARGRLPDALPLLLVEGRSHDVLAAADAVLVASGTATLEAALCRKPMAIAYRMPWLSYRLMRGRGYLPWIGLPNILLGDTVVPEFIQHDATPARMGEALRAFLDSPQRSGEVAERFAGLHAQLRRGCAQRAADVLAAQLGLR